MARRVAAEEAKVAAVAEMVEGAASAGRAESLAEGQAQGRREELSILCR